ncbi:antibiotic biosynthesis monooxygenase [Mesorhizobium sp. M0408]|uniref:putative quinol monooxygenase n=1 Tax=Mesorhizobium sp. M0408 TaxID=2956942 RepID=UPI00333DBF48
MHSDSFASEIYNEREPNNSPNREVGSTRVFAGDRGGQRRCPNVFYFYENWTNRAALDVHLNLPYLKEWFARHDDSLPRRSNSASSPCAAPTTSTRSA